MANFEDQVMKVNAKYDSALMKLAGIHKENEFVIEPHHIEIIHYQMISTYGGLHGIRDNDLLLSTCETIYQDVFGKELYPTVYDKAAKLLESFAHYQIFLDGNKRTGFETMVVYLAMNNIKFDMNNENAYDFVMNVVMNNYSNIQEISDIIRENSYITSHVMEDFEEKDCEKEER